MLMYRGDLKPDLVIELYDDTTPISLEAADSVRLLGALDGVLVIDRDLAARPTDGVLVVPWETGETDTAGDLVVEVEVTWPGARPQTFRAGTPVSILADLG